MPRTSPESVRDDLGRRVSELRRGHALTQEQFAERLGVSTNYVARIEGGYENLTLDSLTRLANELMVPVEQLFVPPADRTARRGRPAKHVKR